MQERLLECFVEAYYEGYNVFDRHELFAQLLAREFEVMVTLKQAEEIAVKIAAEGILIVKDDKGIKEIIG